jgi:hypothetical protein
VCRASRGSELPISTPLQILPCIWPRHCCTILEQSHYYNILFSSELVLSFEYIEATFSDAFTSALNSSIVQTSSCLRQGGLFDLNMVGTSLVHLYKILASLACPTLLLALIFYTCFPHYLLLSLPPQLLALHLITPHM